MSYESITTQEALNEFCQHLATADRIGFDTEFVSEDTFRPELCLIQVATAERLAVIDPQTIDDLNPFWEVLANGSHITLVHAAREEVMFSLRAIEKVPANLFDTQLAAGFCSNEFPASYSSVVSKFIGHRIRKGEQRTDWRRRPLTPEQIDYALEDVRHLITLHDKMTDRLEKTERTDWLLDESNAWLKDLLESRTRQRWRKVSGVGGMSARSLAIVKELWLWRQEEAERLNKPPKRILRDDLIVAITKRKASSADQVLGIRGLHGPARKAAPMLAQCVQRGLDASLERLPHTPRKDMPSQLNLLGQFLTPALSSICRSATIATSLVGTATDVRELIAYRLGFAGADKNDPPSLTLGWRAEVVGHLIEQLLSGEKSIRISDPNSAHPLGFEDV